MSKIRPISAGDYLKDIGVLVTIITEIFQIIPKKSEKMATPIEPAISSESSLAVSLDEGLTNKIPVLNIS